MNNLNLEHKVREILQRCTYSNDNFTKDKRTNNTSQKTNKDYAIRITGNNNIIIEANFLYTTFLFLLACFWMYLCNH